MKSSEDGMTLLELLIAIMIMGIVFATVSAAFVISLASAQDSNQRLLESNDVGFLASPLTHDVQSAQSLSTSAAACGTASELLLLSATWADQVTSPPQQHRVDYLYEGDRVVRRSCATAPGELVLTRTVARPVVTACADCNALTVKLTVDDREHALTVTRRQS